jgi:hypothetical protein
MADDGDRADQEVEYYRAEALRKRRPDGPVANGRCHYCGEELPEDYMRWCDVDCRNAWEALVSRRR